MCDIMVTRDTNMSDKTRLILLVVGIAIAGFAANAYQPTGFTLAQKIEYTVGLVILFTAAFARRQKRAS
jgi:hypothetical protein